MLLFYISLLLHIIDDFVLQPICLNRLKQKNWWINECEKNDIDFTQYQDDYKCALFIHGLSWSIMVSLPLIFYPARNGGLFLSIAIICNAIIHAVVDNLKANEYKISLVKDQAIHLVQIIALYFIFFQIID